MNLLNVFKGMLATTLFLSVSGDPAFSFSETTVVNEIKYEIKEIGHQGFIAWKGGRIEIRHGNSHFVDTSDFPEVEAKFPLHRIISGSGGGTACPAEHFWISFESGTPNVIDSFAGCRETLGDLTIEGDSVVLEVSSNGMDGNTKYILGREEVSSEVVGLRRKIDFNPYNPENWLGTGAYDYARDPSIEAVLLKIMPNSKIASLREIPLIGANGFKIDGDWITDGGCRPSYCNESFAVISINRKSGIPYIAMREWDGEIEYYGPPPNSIPLEMRKFLSKYRYAR